MQLGRLRSVASAPSLRQRMVAGIHQSTAPPTPSNLLSASTSRYVAQSVAALRAECKKRGIKVSGRKAELIDRLTSLDLTGKQTFSTRKSGPKMAKGDTSSIDFYKVPPTYTQKEVAPPVAFAIPVAPDSTGSTSSAVHTEYSSTVPDHGAADSHPTKESGTADSPKVSIPGEEDGSSHEDSSEPELKGSDKTFFAVFAATVTGWWLLGSLTSKSKTKTSH